MQLGRLHYEKHGLVLRTIPVRTHIGLLCHNVNIVWLYIEEARACKLISYLFSGRNPYNYVSIRLEISVGLCVSSSILLDWIPCVMVYFFYLIERSLEEVLAPSEVRFSVPHFPPPEACLVVCHCMSSHLARCYPRTFPTYYNLRRSPSPQVDYFF